MKPVNVARVLQEIQAEQINTSDREERLLKGNSVIGQNQLAMIAALQQIAAGINDLLTALTPPEAGEAASLNLTFGIREPKPDTI